MGAHTYVAEAMDGIRRLVRVLRIGAADAERSTGLSSAQLFVLQQLAEIDAPSINELAERTMTDQSSVSVVVSRLVAKGLAQRVPSPKDARRVTVHITQAGRETIQRSPLLIQQRLIAALQQLPEPSLRAFAHELTHFVARLGAAHEPPTFLFEDDATGTP